MRIISKGADRTDWLIDQSGRIAAELVYQDQKKRWELFARKDGNLAMVAAGESPVDVPSIVGFGPDGDDIVMRFIENGDPVWKRFVLKDQSWGPPLFNGETLHTAILDPRNGRLLGGSLRVGEDRYYFFDNELQAHWDAMLRAFPAERVTFESAANDFHRIIVKVFGAKDGYIYALFDWYTHKAIVLGKLYEGLGEVGEVKSIAYPAADGLTIPAYLTLPPGAAGQSAANLPLIVFPHGGPQIADSGGFDWWAQALAVQGYAVLQPNYRGSSMNFRFVEAGFGEWGRKMQTDLSDGVRYLAGQHLIDPKRVCIVGASYGGYAALAGMTLDPGVYRCAVSVAGLSDLKRMLQWSDRRIGHSDNLNQRYWDRFMAVTGPHDPRLQSISPIDHIEQIGGPILLIHGRDDTVVPYEQSEVMASALKRAGKPFDFLTLKLEDHWLSHSATRLEMLRAVVTFLKANNPP